MQVRTTRPEFPREGVIAAVILAIGTALRLFRITQPAASEGSWRETDGLAIARNMHDGVGSFFAPIVDWTGSSPIATEAPVVPWLAAQLYRVTGPVEGVARGLIVVASVALMFGMWRLGRRWLGPVGGLVVLLVIAMHPLTAYYGRTFLPDVPAMALGVGALCVYELALDRERARDAVGLYTAAGALIFLAVAVKPPLLILGAVFVATTWHRRGWRELFAPSTIAVGLCALVAAGWLALHERAIYDATGNTFGIFQGHDKFEPSLVLTSGWWGVMAQRLLSQTAPVALLPVVAVGFVGACVKARTHPAILVWCALGLVWLFVVAEGNLDMPHYQLQLVPPLALTCAMAFTWIASVPSIKARRWVALGLAVSLALGLVSGLRFALHSMATHDAFLADARTVDAALPDGARVLLLGGNTHHDDGDDFDPRPFYHTRTTGWALDDAGYDLAGLAAYCHKGARFVLVRKPDPHLRASGTTEHAAATDGLRQWLRRPPLLDTHHLTVYDLDCAQLPPPQFVWTQIPGTDARPDANGWRILGEHDSDRSQ